MKKIVAVIIMLLLLVPFPRATEALSCAMTDPIERMQSADGVIVAKVLESKEVNHTLLITVDVEKSYKGVTEPTITFTENFMWGESQPNISYVYFLNLNDGEWTLPLCGSVFYDYAKQIDYLTELEKWPLVKLEQNDITKNDDKINNDTSEFTTDLPYNVKQVKTTQQNAELLFIIIATISILFISGLLYLKLNRRK